MTRKYNRNGRARRDAIPPRRDYLSAIRAKPGRAPLLGHTDDYADDSRPVLIDPVEGRLEASGFAADLRCPDCEDARPYLVLDEGGDVELIVLEHSRSCPFIRANMRAAQAMAPGG